MQTITGSRVYIVEISVISDINIVFGCISYMLFYNMYTSYIVIWHKIYIN